MVRPLFLCFTVPINALHSSSGDFPGRRSSCNQHGSACCARFSQGFVEPSHAGAPHCNLRSQNGALVIVFGRRLTHLNLFPVCLKLIGNNHGMGGQDALSHLGIADEDGDLIVRGNGEPGIGTEPRDRLLALVRRIDDLVPQRADGNSEGQASAREPFKKARLVMEVFVMSCPPSSSFEWPF